MLSSSSGMKPFKEQETQMQDNPTQHVAQAINSVLTATLTPATHSNPAKSRNIETWAKYLRFDLRHNEPGVYPQMTAMVKAAANLICDIKAPARERPKPRWVSFVGTSGGGKTYLANAIYNWVWRYGRGQGVAFPGDPWFGIAFCHWPTMAADLLSNRGYDRVEELGNANFVFIDEIGAERDKSGHVRDNLVRLASCLVGHWAIWTSNLNLEQIEKDIDTRMASRMTRDGNVVVEVNAPDYCVSQ